MSTQIPKLHMHKVMPHVVQSVARVMVQESIAVNMMRCVVQEGVALLGSVQEVVMYH